MNTVQLCACTYIVIFVLSRWHQTEGLSKGNTHRHSTNLTFLTLRHHPTATLPTPNSVFFFFISLLIKDLVERLVVSVSCTIEQFCFNLFSIFIVCLKSQSFLQVNYTTEVSCQIIKNSFLNPHAPPIKPLLP